MYGHYFNHIQIGTTTALINSLSSLHADFRVCRHCVNLLVDCIPQHIHIDTAVSFPEGNIRPMSTPSTPPNWDNHSRAQASRQWRRQSATMGQNVTDAIVAATQVTHGMRVLDVACGSGEPAISIATLLN